MVGWAEPARPKSLLEVVGQAEAVSDLRRLLTTDQPLNLILTGPSGVGKTTLARIWSQGQACERALELGDVCNTCASCREFKSRNGAQQFRSIFGADLDDGQTDYLLKEVIRQEPFLHAHHVIFIDEAQTLSPRISDRLLAALEAIHTTAIFVFALVNEEALPLPLRRRCAVIALHQPSLQNRVAVAGRIASANGLGLEDEALELVAQSTSDFRAIARQLERISLHGLTNVSDIRELLIQEPRAVLRWLARCLQLTTAHEASVAEPGLLRFLEVTRQLLAHLLQEQLQLPSPSTTVGLVHLVPPAELLDLSQVMLDAAERHGGDAAALKARLAAFARGSGRVATELDAKVELQTLALTLGTGVGLSAPAASSRRRRPQARKSLKSATSSSPPTRAGQPFGSATPSAWLSPGQVRSLVSAASFCLQAYRAPINLQAVITEESSTPFVGKLCTRLAEHLGRQRGGRASDVHFLWLRETISGEARSTALVSVPAPQRSQAAAWLAEAGDGRLQITPEPSSSARADIARHWSYVRALLSGATAEAVTPTGSSLLDALKVPVDARRPAGLVTGRRFGTSQTLGPAAVAEEEAFGLPLLSAFDDAAWSWIDRGWELKEHADRARLRLGRERAVMNLRRLFSRWEDEEAGIYSERLQLLEETWEQTAYNRPRSWSGWW